MVTLALDHLLVWGDVDGLRARVADATGVRPDDGGAHPGVGTRNAIFAGRGGRALELIGPDPAQGALPPWAPGVRDGALWWWAARTDAPIPETRDRLGALGLATADPQPGTRRRPDGSTVAWTTLDVVDHPYGTALPFVIRWGDGAPPWLAPSPPCEIRGVRIAHPEARALRALLAALGLADVPVEHSDAPSIEAELVGPRGAMRFSGP